MRIVLKPMGALVLLLALGLLSYSAVTSFERRADAQAVSPRGLLAVGASAGGIERDGKVLFEAEANNAEVFRTRYHGQTVVAGDTTPPAPWAANCWDGESDGEVALSEDGQGRVLRLTNTRGKGAIQLYTVAPVILPAGRAAIVRGRYRTLGSGIHGTIAVRETIDPNQEPITVATGDAPGTNDVWTPFALAVPAGNTGQDRALTLLLQNVAPPRSSGVPSVLEIRALRLLEDINSLQGAIAP